MCGIANILIAADGGVVSDLAEEIVAPAVEFEVIIDRAGMMIPSGHLDWCYIPHCREEWIRVPSIVDAVTKLAVACLTPAFDCIVSHYGARMVSE
tara:strand:- start:1241 stop:1525 length:285 start_codon:yes stop_codon:yes gene_type:complete